MATKYHKPVARAASLAAALALTIPLAPLAASASKATNATTVQGTVVATNTARHTLVIAAGNAMDTVRFASAGAVAKVALGTRLTVRASRLADGTFKALASHARGRVDRAMIHGTVVSDVASNLVLSTGASTVAVDHASAVVTAAKAGRHSHASGSSLGVGTDVRVGVIIRPTSLDATSVTETGLSGFIGLEGTIVTLPSSASPTTLTIAVEDGANTTVTIPSSITLPSTINVGDQVELLTSWANNVFTLVTITDDSIAATQSTDGVSMDQNGAGYIQGEGLVTGYTAAASVTSPGSLIVQPGDGATAMTFSVPYTVTVPAGLQVGSRVHVAATLSGTTLTAVSIRLQQIEGEGNGSMTTQTEGLVTVIPTTTSATLTVQPGDGAAPVTFVVPSSLTVDVSSIAVGARVHAVGFFDATNNNALTLQSVRVQQPEGDQGGQGGQSSVVHVDGTFVGLIGDVLTIQPNDQAAPMTFAVASGFTLPAGIVDTTPVTVTATMVGTVLTVVNIAPND